MQRFFTLIIFLLIYSTSFAQIDSTKTEIIIIGTIHTGNKNFNHKKLYKVLKSLNPDIILYEYSEKYKPVFGLKTANFLIIAKPCIEQLALQSFSKRNRNTIILPYDTTFARRQYLRKIIKLKTIIFDSLQIVTKDYLDSLNFANCVSKRNNYYELYQEKTLEEINEPKIYNIARELYKDDKELILPLIKKYLKDIVLIKDFENDLNFWDTRNNFMVRQIEEYSMLYPKKKIIVLTGLNHKYFLTDSLTRYRYKNIKLTEISNR